MVFCILISISLKTIHLLRNTLFLGCGVQDRFFLKNLDHSPTFLLFSLVLGDPFQVGLSPSDIPVVLGSIPIAFYATTPVPACHRINQVGCLLIS